MSDEQIAKALTKLYESLLVKGKFQFKVEVTNNISSYNSTPVYKIKILVLVDHAKFWSESPDYDSNYSEIMDNMFDNWYEEFDSLYKYVLPTEMVMLSIKFKHFDTDIYKPLLNYIGELNIPYVTNFSEHLPTITVTLDENSVDDQEEVYEDINDKFNIDDIILSFEPITEH
jgi:hypothetical protein